MTTAAQMAKARAATEKRQHDIDAAVAAIEFPLPRPDTLTREEIKERATVIEDAVAGIDWTPADASNPEADRRTVQQRNEAIVKATKALK